ncbi:MAG: EAL domain-containing protein [Sulfurospirillaceae bacterium]|nr:EAL domain-containing protein [Sulfurospirillaceae bacterium]
MSSHKRIKYFKQIAILLTFFWTILTVAFVGYQFYNEKQHILDSSKQKIKGVGDESVAFIYWAYEEKAKILSNEQKYTLQPLSHNAQQINTLLSHNIELNNALENGKPFGLFVTLGEQTFAVTLLPMKGITGRVDGYLIAYQPDNTPLLLRRDFLISIILNALGAIIVTSLLLVLVQRTRLIEQERNELEVITDTMMEGMYTIDIEGKILQINARALEILGYTREELIGKEAHSTFHSHSLNQHVSLQDCPLFRALQAGEAFNGEEQYYTCKDAHMIPVEIHGQPLFKEGIVTCMVTTFRDLSGQRASDAQMKLLYHALETTTNAIVITNKDALVEWANPAFEDLTGYTIAEAIGKKPSELVRSGEQNQQFYEQMWSTILAKEAWHGEVINRKKNGQLYYEELSITSVLNQQNNIEHFVAIKQDISNRKQSEDAVHKLAFYDSLTQLPHRRLLLEHLDKAISHTKRANTYGAVFFLDIDYFKKINDTYGHAIGDLLLQSVAVRLNSLIRIEDTLSRFGGDEFVILIENLGSNSSMAAIHSRTIAKSIHDAMQQPFELEGHLRHITMSIGITLFHDMQESKEDILKHADMALYKAKASGRNTTRFYDNQMQEALELRANLEDDIHLALTNNQFVLYYQPKLDDHKTILGAELLLRWQHPSQGLIPPNEFLPIAQDFGLIEKIGLFVLEHASKQLQEWNTKTTSHLSLSVNISSQELEQENFVSKLLALFAHNYDDLKRLTLELSESTILKTNPYIFTVIQTLHQKGVKFAIDNFGAGYVSLNTLKNLPIDEVKIDKSLIKALDGTKDATSIINAMMAIGESFGLHTVAEGIETLTQMETLVLEGCDTFQGFLLGKPLPFENFKSLLEPKC